MIRQKLTIDNYTYIIDYFFANEDLRLNPHSEKFYLARNYDVLSNITVDRDIYFISKKIFDLKKNDGDIIFPIPHKTAIGYSIKPKDFSDNIINLNVDDLTLFKLYDKNFKESEILCDKIKIYFPTVNPNLNAIIDLNNFVNDVTFHYYIDDISEYERYSQNEFVCDNFSYSEFIEIYVPSINELLYNSNIQIKDYNINTICVDVKNTTGEEKIVNADTDPSFIPFNLLYYPFRILEYNTGSEILTKKSFIETERYINNQFYSTFSILLYPYIDINAENKFVVDKTYSSVTFNIDLSFSLNTEIRFPYPDEITGNESFYGIPSLINNFKYPNSNNISLLDAYLKFNGNSIDDYDFYLYEDHVIEDDIFGEDFKDIERTGFLVEISKDNNFKTSFFKYTINIEQGENVIDNLIFPLKDIFSSWDDVPQILVARVTYIDRVSSNAIVSNTVIINKEWYKYLVEGSYKPKLKLDNLYKKYGDNMIVANKENVLFIDKINANIVKSNDSNEKYNLNKSSSPKVIYKPIFFRTTDLDNITIKSNVKQNVGINLGEYMSKVETFKLTLDDSEYIEYGRNDIFVIFNINAKNITSSSGKYVITNENDDFISDGNWSLI